MKTAMVSGQRGGYRLSGGDGQAGGAAVEPTRAAGDLIWRHYNDRQTIIIGYPVSTAAGVLIPPADMIPAVMTSSAGPKSSPLGDDSKMDLLGGGFLPRG